MRLDVCAVLLLFASTASAQTTLFEVGTRWRNDSHGIAIANVGDMDGDGYADLGVGAPKADIGQTDTGAVYVYSGRTGLRLHRFRAAPGVQIGTSVCAAGDVDQDGFADILMGGPGVGKGRARICSGRTGAVIRTVEGKKVGDGFGSSVGNVGDIDGDGVDDHAVSAAPKPSIDYVRIFSGKTGAILREHSSPLAHQNFGRALLGVGDFDGAGRDDYAIGDPFDTAGGSTEGDSAMRVYSGETGSILFGLAGSTQTDLFGWALATPGDHDGDGKSDIWLGAPGDNYARLYGGVTGTAILQEHRGRGHFGHAVACADVDGDGRRDLVVSAPDWDTPTMQDVGAVEVFSGRNGLRLLRLEGEHAHERMGSSLAGLGDLDGDGYEEIAVAATNAYVRVLSPIDQTLSSTKPNALVSSETGGTVDFDLAAGPAFASQVYLLLGSASGTFPLVPLAPGVALSLVPDWYTQAILVSLGSPVFGGFLGTLDASGAGQATLDLSGGVDPAMVGITLFHAFVVFDATGSAAFASNSLPSKLVPDPNQFPTCDFSAPPFEPPETELVFDGSAAIDPNGSSLVHAWEFGDGSSATGAVVTHAYASDGLYDVAHRVQEEDGNTSTCTREVGVDFCFAVTSFFGIWIFGPIASNDGFVVFYAWDFGDGSSVATDLPTVSHTYSASGTYTVTLTLTDDHGLTSSCTRLVVVP